MYDKQWLKLPTSEQAYLCDLVRSVHGCVGDALLGVYLGGSAAAGAYEPGTSDLDVQAVVARPQDHAVLRGIASELTHHTLPCPARRLDFVVYERQAIGSATRHPRFSMNFNTGSAAEDALYLAPREEDSHWFLLDIAMGHAVGRTLYGAEFATVFALVPRMWQLEAILASMAWHQQNDAVHPDTVLNACRGWRYAVTDRLGSKQAGAMWAQQQPDCPLVVAQAVAHRHVNTSIDAEGARVLLARIAAVIRDTLDNERRPTTNGRS